MGGGRLIMLLSPAKTLDLSAASAFVTPSTPAFVTAASTLVDEVAKLSKPQLKSLLAVSDAITTLNYDRYRGFKDQASKQCALAYDGPAYKGLQAGGFTKDEQAFAQDHLRILSGLYGVLRPYDDIKPYRLDMGTKLANKKGKNLYEFWDEAIALRLEKDLASQGSTGKKTIINCASQEYFKSVKQTSLEGETEVITCAFPGPAVFAKKARGMMCRFITENKLCDPSGVKDFEGYGEDRYSFSAAQSTDTEFVFLRRSCGGGKKAATAATTTAKAKNKDANKKQSPSIKREAPAADEPLPARRTRSRR